MNFFSWIIKNIVFGVGLWTIAKWVFKKNHHPFDPQNHFN